MPNYRRYYISHAPVFVTVVTKNRTPWLIDHVDQLLNAMSRAKQKYPYKHIAHVILPDHFHWLFSLTGERSLSVSVNTVKSFSAREINRILRRHGGVWQRGFYDRAIRREENLKHVARYIVANPLRAGIVGSIGEYPFWDMKWL